MAPLRQLSPLSWLGRHKYLFAAIAFSICAALLAMMVHLERGPMQADVSRSALGGIQSDVGRPDNLELQRLREENVRLESELNAARATIQQLSERLSEFEPNVETLMPEDLQRGWRGGAEVDRWRQQVMLQKGDRWKRSCALSPRLQSYLNYTVRQACPNDWPDAQDLMFIEECYALPRRTCFAIAPPFFPLPPPFPDSLWTEPPDTLVSWDYYQPKGFQALKERQFGDCKTCFDLDAERGRWGPQVFSGDSEWNLEKIIDYTKGSLRIGLDVGGGTGTFAAQCAVYNLTIMTTGYDWHLPYLSTIAWRGLIPLHISRSMRLPLFDFTMDIIHAASSIKYLPVEEFEHLMFDWYRVLRPKGLIWLENFYAPDEDVERYIAVIDLFDFKKLEWKVPHKTNQAEFAVSHKTLFAILEKT